MALGWVVVACAKGRGGIVNKFLSWGVFQPVAKISYMTYLTHLSVMNMLWNNSRTYGAEPSYFFQVLRRSPKGWAPGRENLAAKARQKYS